MDQGETIEIRPLNKGVNDSDPDNLDLIVFSIGGIEVDYTALPDTIVMNGVGTVIVKSDEILFTTLETGTVVFPYVIKNTNGDSATADQIIEVTPVAGSGSGSGSGAPIAVDDAYTTDKDESVIIYPLTRGINDSAPSGDPLKITHIAGQQVTYNALPQTISLQGGSIIVYTANNIEFIPTVSFLGEVIFSYEISDGNQTDTATITIEVIENSVKASFKDSALRNNFEIYPNPSKGNVIIFLKSSSAGDVQVTLSDVTGKIIYAGAARLKEGQNELDFNFNVNSGVLFLNIRNEQVNYGTSKIIFR